MKYYTALRMNERELHEFHKQAKSKTTKQTFLPREKQVAKAYIKILSVKNNTMYCSGCVCSENIKTQ